MDGFYETISEIELAPTLLDMPHAMQWSGPFGGNSKVEVNCWSINGLNPSMKMEFPKTIDELVDIFDEVYAFVVTDNGEIVQQGLMTGDSDLPDNVEPIALHRLSRRMMT